MTRRCELTGKSVQSGNNVSHSNRKVRRVWRPNLSHVTLISQALGIFVSVRVCKAALRTVDLAGGLDAYLLERANPEHLSLRMKRLLNALKKKRKNKEASTAAKEEAPAAAA